MRFEIEYELMGRMHTTYADRIQDIRNGFWVTKVGQFTKGSDCYSFILPHMINYIFKIDTLQSKDE